MYELWKALFSEFLGTFILTFVGLGATAINIAQGGSVLGSALAFGITYLVLIYTIGNYSSAQFNPAISFGMAVAGRMGWCRMLLYWIAQILGAIAGVGLISWLFGIDFYVPGGELVESQPWKSIVLEMFLTFFLVFTFLFMTRNPMVSLISGFVIGLALTAIILVGGFYGRSGANPAFSLAGGIFFGNLGSIWALILGPLLGSLLAVLVYKIMTIPWTCSELVEKGCNNCGELPFYEEWKFCLPDVMQRGQQMFENNQRELESMDPAVAACYSPCQMPVRCVEKPKCETVCEPICEPVAVCEPAFEAPCEPVGNVTKKRSYRYRQL